MRTNTLPAPVPVFTHEGGKGKSFTPFQELNRAVLTCMLLEDTFYEKGDDQASRIAGLIPLCKPDAVLGLAIEARQKFHLRHVPLFVTRELARVKGAGRQVEAALSQIVQRPDELGEYISLFWKDKKQPLSAASKRGLALAFGQFNAYELAKWNRNNDKIKLRDVIRLVHPKPKDAEQSTLWKKLIADEIESPDTWEVALSAGADKKETFERLIREKKLGGLALLRNLRNCQQSGVDLALLREAIDEHPFPRVLPFRFLAAAHHAPGLEPQLDGAMKRAATTLSKLPGRTTVLVDVSGSMDAAMSGKSDLTRMDAACGLAILAAFCADQFMVASFSDNFVLVPPRTGMALRDAIVGSQSHGSTMLGKAIQYGYTLTDGFSEADRVIVITDEQAQDSIPAFVADSKQPRYLINVAGYRNGVEDGGGWHRISGFSERIFDYIAEYEKQ
jgi:60 kDa SS-A/Ro ribonucleoprotein